MVIAIPDGPAWSSGLTATVVKNANAASGAAIMRSISPEPDNPRLSKDRAARIVENPDIRRPAGEIPNLWIVGHTDARRNFSRSLAVVP
jgi:hypothetical protein